MPSEQDEQLAAVVAQNAQLTALLDAVPDRLLLVSADNRFLYMNAAARATLRAIGITTDPIGKTPAELGLASVFTERIDDLRPRVLEGGETITRELQLPTAGAGLRWQEDQISPVRCVSGVVEAIAVISRDIHQRKIAEELRDQMIGVLGHDLRNPLTAISVLSKLTLRGEVLPDSLRPRLDQIDKAAGRALEMIKSLLEFSEGRSQGFEITPIRANLSEICRAVIDEVSASHAGVPIDLAAEGDCMCDCDPPRLGQVVANLISNAIAHGEPDLPVRVSIATADAEISISVTNRGPAIPADFLPLLFEPFLRGPGAEKRARGLGLGLFIVRAIVTAHRGSVTVASNDVDGTCFQVSLPRMAS